MTISNERDEHRAKAELLDLLLNATQDGIVDWNVAAGEADYNPRWRLLLGFDDDDPSAATSSPDHWQELIHPDEQATVASMLSDHLEQGWPFSPTIRMRHRSGGYRHILCRGTSLRDAQDRAVRMVIVFSDIDEKIREESRVRAMVSAMPDTLFRVSADGTINGVRRGSERDGSPFAALREGTSLADSFSDPRVFARLQAALFGELSSEPQSTKTISVATSTAAGSALHHEVRIVRSDDDESVCIVRDVTEQRELEERLLESQKLGAIGQLAAGVAHEINTPMQFIGDNLHFAKTAVTDLVALLEQLKKATQDAENAPLGQARLEQLVMAEADADFEYAREALPTALERSLNGVERVTKIVRAMKSFAHPGGDQLAPTDLRGLIESTVMVATNEWRYVADVDMEFDPNLPTVPCIAGELNQVVLNLIVNASHAIADVVAGTDNKGRIIVKASSDETHAEIRIADTGTGIPEHARAKVFEPFFTTKEVGKGTGQGLSLAYNCIVKRHKGTINFETELGTGTTFVIRLPLEAPPMRSGIVQTPFPM
jgi:two-component system, NtrC family, sensor kinase